jgi:DNA-binding transcriptional MerR regulator
MADDRLSFKEMCAAFDVTPRTLRYYEYIELLSPERDGRARFYTPRDVARMTLIMRGRRFGFSLEQVRQWLLIRDEQGTEAQMRTLVDAADAQLAKLDDQIASLQEARADLAELRAKTAKALDQADMAEKPPSAG